MRQGLLVIFDGLGDRPSPLLDGRTPLEAASTPNLDRLAAASVCGLVDTTVPGVAVATEAGSAVLLGMRRDAAREIARGPVEAAGLGLALAPGDVAVHCNFATIEAGNGTWRIVDRRAGRIREGTRELAVALNEMDVGHGIVATFVPATQHRAVLRLSGPGLSASIGDTDPGAGVSPSVVHPCVALDDAAGATAEAINEYLRCAHEVLRAHPVNRAREAEGLLPANGLITRGAGSALDWDGQLRAARLRGAVVAAERTVLGMGAMLGYSPRTDPRFTAAPDTDLAAKVETVRAALADHDLVVLHLKGTDICAHDRDPEGKRDFLERADAAIAPLLDEDLVIGVTSDHGTDSNTGVHCADPVPALLRVPGGPADGLPSFNEQACGRGTLSAATAEVYFARIVAALQAG